MIIVFSFVGCGTTADEETTTTNMEEQEIAEIMQWTMANVMSKHSASRQIQASLYEEVKKEVDSYKSTLPFPVEITLETPSVSDAFFKISIIF